MYIFGMFANTNSFDSIAILLLALRIAEVNAPMSGVSHFPLVSVFSLQIFVVWIICYEYLCVCTVFCFFFRSYH